MPLLVQNFLVPRKSAHITKSAPSECIAKYAIAKRCVISKLMQEQHFTKRSTGRWNKDFATTHELHRL